METVWEYLTNIHAAIYYYIYYTQRLFKQTRTWPRTFQLYPTIAGTIMMADGVILTPYWTGIVRRWLIQFSTCIHIRSHLYTSQETLEDKCGPLLCMATMYKLYHDNSNSFHFLSIVNKTYDHNQMRLFNDKDIISNLMKKCAYLMCN